MCGRFTLTAARQTIEEAFDVADLPEQYHARYNVAPQQRVLAITAQDARRLAREYRWGLVPSWASDPDVGYKLINARAETVAQKPAFRAAFRERRCLVVADGFFEWRAETVLGPTGRTRQVKVPSYIRLKTRELFAFAGLWESWKMPIGQLLHSCAIITTEANATVAPLHDRMPVILPPTAYATWLEADDPVVLEKLLRPAPDDWLETFEVSRLVNDVSVDQPECVRPVPTQQALF